MATILIVDDLSANRKFLVTLLGAHGHHMLEAVDGREALAIVGREHPDLVITDVLMPVMDGYELLKQLRLDPATRQTPLVFSTAYYGEREARELALSSGVAHVLTKPVQSAEVLKVVRRVLDGEADNSVPADTPPLNPAFDGEHLRLVTDKLSEKAGDLRSANARLRALINIGLELASERDCDTLLHRVCVAARDLFGATYVTLGILDLKDRKVQHFVTCGAEDTAWMKHGDPVSGVLEEVVSERRTMRLANPGGDPLGIRLPARHPEVQAFLAAPIASPAHVYGWICFVGNEGRAFTEDDEHLVTALSGQVGRIYENTYFAAEAQKRAAELERQILERKQAELALRAERDDAQRYLDTAEVILLKLDTDARIMLVNRYACAILGSTAEELVGRDWIETCIPARMRTTVRRKFTNVLSSGDLAIIENPVITRSGEERLIEWRNRLLHDDDGRVVGTFSSGTDITERTEAADAVRTAEERVRFALEAAGVGIWDMDCTTGVIQWSEILEAQYGMKPGTFDGTFAAFLERIHPDDRESVAGVFARAMKSGDDFSILNRSIRANGTVRWLSGAGRVRLGEHGEPLRGVGISLDITEQRTLEEQYHQAQKMEAIGQLAGGVAHDFNNLLTAILGYCELVLADLASGDPKHADMVEIQKAGSRAAGLTRQLLAFSRKQVIQPTLLDLNDVVSDLQSMLVRLIGEDVKIVLSLRPGLSAVKADRGQIEQVVMNLVLNARDAMPHGGALTIQTADIELDGDYAAAHFSVTPGSYIALTVTDTGTGITPAVQARLFEPFFTTKEPGKGTGLGLATIHGIVTRIGGSVHVYSEVGKGTSFTVYLPRAIGEMAATAAPVSARPPAGTQTVLVVEDAAPLRQLARRLLQRQGYKVLIAADAIEAVELFDQNPSIDILLTDVVMPGASGPELTRQLIERRPTLKVIYMSGYTEEAIVHHAALDSQFAFLNKPFTADALGRKVREVLDRKTGVTEI